MRSREIITGLIIAFALAVFVSPFASPFLDGLEKVAEEKAFLDSAEDHALSSPVPDYLWPGIENERMATAAAGALGAAAAFLTVYGLALLLRRARP